MSKSQTPTKRLDVLLAERGLAKSREQAQAFIMAGEVFGANNQKLDKASVKFPEDAHLELRPRKDLFASRAGHKLHHALETFGLEVKDLVCLDVGASTGGFTDCLLKRGARHVFAIDVGYGQLEAQLRQQPQVTNLEKTNARTLTLADLSSHNILANEASFVVMDVSFISLQKIIEPLHAAIPRLKTWVLLFKPQFEVGPKYVLKGGVVKDKQAVKDAIHAFNQWMGALGFELKHGPETSPIAGKKSGNLEYLLHYETHT